MKLARRLALATLTLICALAGAVAIRTWGAGSRQVAVTPAPPLPVDIDAATRRLSEAVALRTVSFAPGIAPATEEFRKLHRHLEGSFPKAHAAMRRETVGGLTLLYTWDGRDSSARPVVLMAHQDVVPIAPGTEQNWKVEPFSGKIDGGFVWGRGAWDNKANLMAMLEAIERLAGEGFRPRQSIILVLGHDEEIGGHKGAFAVAELLRSRNIKAEMVLDEGMLVTEGIMTGLAAPAALIGVAEKGYLTLELTASAVPGHSSMPPSETAIGTLSAALARLQAQPRKAAISGVARAMFEAMAPDMQGLNRVLLSNLWLFEPLVRTELEKKPSTNAMLRTTAAPTVLMAGEKDNVLPGRAKALVNFRLLPGDRIAEVLADVRRIAGPGVSVEPQAWANEASPVSPSTSAGYRVIERTIRETFPGALVAPGLMIAATDSRHMIAISENIYRFSPVRAKAEDLARFHGTDERIAVSNYAEMIRFYHRLLGNLSAPATVAEAR